MTELRLLWASERWLRLLLWLYPYDFRDDMGDALVEAYRDRCRAALRGGGVGALASVWLRALADSLRNGLGERARPAVAWPRTGSFGRDTERVLRRLGRAPVFVTAMLGTLTLGLGAFAMVYTFVDRVLVAPLPYRQPNDLYFVWRDYGWFDLRRGWLGGTDVEALRTAGGVIEDAVAIERGQATLGGSDGADPRVVAVMSTSAGFFPMLGARPMIGRGFAPREHGPGRPHVVVLGHDLWRERFGGDRSVVGRDVRLDGTRYRVIGVMGPEFRFLRNASLGPPQTADAFTTMDEVLAEADPEAGSYAGLVRARPGTTPRELEEAVAKVGAMLDRRDFSGAGLRLYPVGAKADLIAGVRPALVVLGLAGVVLVLVLAVNLASLLLVRAAQREREFAISRALGATPRALARATLLEGGILGMLGGACGALAAVWGTRALVALAPMDLPRRESIAVDWRIALAVTAVGLAMGVAAGAVPAFWVARAPLSSLLHNAAVRGGGHGRMRRAMVVVQVALSLVLLSSGGLVARSFDRLLSTDPGFDPAGVLTLRVPLPEALYPDSAAVVAAHARIHREISAIPGVEAAGASSAIPLTADADQSGIVLPGAPGNTGDAGHDRPLVDHVAVRAGYFQAMGIRVLAGHVFGGEPARGRGEVVIDRVLAEQFFPTGNPVGATLVFGADSLRVAGVVEHARQYDVHRDGRPQVYVRHERYVHRTLSFAVRSDRDPAGMAADIRDAVARIDPSLAISQLRPMDDVVGDAIRQQRVSAVLIGGFSLGALLLAAMGLYGVVSGAVSRRRQELAVRLALGADHARVLRLVLREGAVLILLGLLVGVPGIYLAGRAIRGVLVGVSPFDPPTLAAVTCGLAAVALAACYLPARRVVRIEPARSLRQE